MDGAAVQSPEGRWKTFGSGNDCHVLIVEGSRVYDLSPEFRTALDARDPSAVAELAPILNRAPPVSLEAPAPIAPQSISLNVSSSCNLSCTYCYAGRGSFAGAQKRQMAWPTARAAIDKLLSSSTRGAPATIGYIGGEPFVNRKLIHRATDYAAGRGRELGQDVRFSVTTNGTILKQDDVQLLRSYPFAVTVSVDGGRAVQERQRPGADFARLVRAVTPLLEQPGRAKISARATVTRDDFDLTGRYDAIRDLGFDDIGFAPVRIAADGSALHGQDWSACLAAYIALGARELKRLKRGQHSCFSNLVVALKQIHRGACAPYPCGAGGGYFSVASDGRWYACHRAIGDARFAMGDSAGLDAETRTAFLREHHVHNQTNCRTCWARYLCSGSCHHEAQARNRHSCDFIRGWLEFCLTAYAALGRAGTERLIAGGGHGREIQASSA